MLLRVKKEKEKQHEQERFVENVHVRIESIDSVTISRIQRGRVFGSIHGYHPGERNRETDTNIKSLARGLHIEKFSRGQKRFKRNVATLDFEKLCRTSTFSIYTPSAPRNVR